MWPPNPNNSIGNEGVSVPLSCPPLLLAGPPALIEAIATNHSTRDPSANPERRAVGVDAHRDLLGGVVWEDGRQRSLSLSEHYDGAAYFGDE